MKSREFVDENPEDVEEKIERDPELVFLWKKYKFFGEPPVKGSPVEERLRDTCRRYMEYATNPEQFKKIVNTDSENYFSQGRPLMKTGESNAARRELHNQIALMVVGSQRSGMNVGRAEELADFASEYIYGCKVDEAIHRKLEGNLEEVAAAGV
jgi:hypothetical protein